MAVNLSPIWGAGAQLLDNSGNVLSGGKIYTYAAGTTTQVATYTSNSGVTANSNPIVLNSAGRVPYEIWLTDGQNYKFVLKDSNDVLIGTWDNLSGINSNFIAYTNQQEIQTATAGQTVFNLTTMQYLPGTGNLSVFVDGINQYGPGAQYAFVETDQTTVTFASGLHVGAEVKFTSTQIQNAGVTDASQISYTYPDPDAVTQNVEDRLAQYVNVKDFGAVGDGVTDDSEAIQNAIDAVTDGFVFFSQGTYKCNSQILVDTTKVGLNGNGCVLDFSGITVYNSNNSAIDIINSGTDANLRAVQNSTHPIENFRFIGPLGVDNNVVAITINDASGVNAICGVRVNNCTFTNFNRDVYMGIGCFCNTFSQCQFTVFGATTLYSVSNPNSTNSGERNEFISCMWFNRKNVFDQSNISADTYFNNCSFDYAGGRSMTLTGGYTTLTNCHIEDSNDTDWWFYVNSQSTWVYTTLTLIGCNITTGAAKANYAHFYCDDTVTNGGVFITSSIFVQGNTWTAKLVDGAGNAYSTDNAYINQVPVISDAQNSLAYGQFESANWEDEWTLAGTTPPARSTTQKHAGTYSILFTGASANAPMMITTAKIVPGQYATVEWWNLVQSITGTSCQFYVNMSVLDRGGNQLENYNYNTTTNVTSWTKNKLYPIGPAPKGAVEVKLTIGMFGAVSGAPLGYVDDVLLTIS